MRAALVTMVLAACACAAWAGEPAGQKPASVAEGMRDFERNAALGAVLETRPGTPAELGEAKLLAERGVKAARELAGAQPESADAQYLLGSWLLYGYRVVEVEQISVDAEGGTRTETVSRTVQGMADDPQVGLDALKRATELAPGNGEYLLDYAAALSDYDRPLEARSILKGIWAGQPALSQEQRMRAGFFLSGLSEAEGDLAGAREWIYSALSLDPMAAEGVERLRQLDAAEVAAAEASQAPVEEYEAPEEEVYEEEPYEEEYEGVGEEEYDEGYGQEYEQWEDFETGDEGWSEEEYSWEENGEAQQRDGSAGRE